MPVAELERLAERGLLKHELPVRAELEGLRASVADGVGSGGRDHGPFELQGCPLVLWGADSTSGESQVPPLRVPQAV